MIDELSFFGEQIEAVIINRRALSSGKSRSRPRGYEYMCKGYEGDTIYGSDEVKEDILTLGQRVTIYVDRNNVERYWVDLESARAGNEKSGHILTAYEKYKGEGILNEIFHAYDDHKSTKKMILIWIAVMTVFIAGIPFFLLVQFLFLIWSPSETGFPYRQVGFFVLATIPFFYFMYNFYKKVSLVFGKAFFDGLQKILMEIQNKKTN